MPHYVADVDGMWSPCECGANRDHDHPEIAAPTRVLVAH